MESLSIYFDNNEIARSYIMQVFREANQYGYIAYTSVYAIFHTRQQKESEDIYAIFNLNRNKAQQPWFLIGFIEQSKIRGISRFPGNILEVSTSYENNNRNLGNENNKSINLRKKTLIVSAIQKEYTAYRTDNSVLTLTISQAKLIRGKAVL